MAAVNITMENNRRKEELRRSSIKCAENKSPCLEQTEKSKELRIVTVESLLIHC